MNELKQLIKPDITESMAIELFKQLNQESLKFKGKNLCSYKPEEFLSFINERFSVRSVDENINMRQLSRGKPLNTTQLIQSLNYPIESESAIRAFLHSESCPTTAGCNLMFRAGKYSVHEDEMGRCRNHYLNRHVFDLAAVNVKMKKHGKGLYCTPYLKEAASYLHQPYNYGKPCILLAIYIKPGTKILDLSNDGNFTKFLVENRLDLRAAGNIKTDVFKDKCYISGCH
ncbi:hypothetical protein [Endozoicomonas ascidiicola]|uniref:hypothetical protein n=1 Tax=Endozoicomonas ascidiicola TaxID=1698521 RepID=UPI0015615B21|nr:hypothetical protein [Endozoicomonas ascidiicola]